MKSWKTGLLAGLAFALAAVGSASAQGYPNKPIRVIVPTSAGGSVDTIARIVQRYADTSGALGQNIVVVNMPGAGGTIGTRAVLEADPDGYTIGLWHEGLITSKVMGVVDYDHTKFRILGVTGYSEIGLGVGEDGEIDSYDDLIAKAKANPDKVLVATNVGLAVHFVPLMLQDKAGVVFRYVQVGGGAKRFPSVVAGHTDAAIFSVSEFVKWQTAKLKPIVIFADERVPELPEVPTAKEKGIDLVANGMLLWMAPKDAPEEAVNKLVGLLRAAVESPEGTKALTDAGYRAVFIDANETVNILDEWKANAEPLVATAKQLKADE
jgi:tripartite-type tricarboxylate transporter receptor subunit TctC